MANDWLREKKPHTMEKKKIPIVIQSKKKVDKKNSNYDPVKKKRR